MVLTSRPYSTPSIGLSSDPDTVTPPQVVFAEEAKEWIPKWQSSLASFLEEDATHSGWESEVLTQLHQEVLRYRRYWTYLMYHFPSLHNPAVHTCPVERAFLRARLTDPSVLVIEQQLRYLADGWKHQQTVRNLRGHLSGEVEVRRSEGDQMWADLQEVLQIRPLMLEWLTLLETLPAFQDPRLPDHILALQWLQDNFCPSETFDPSFFLLDPAKIRRWSQLELSEEESYQRQVALRWNQLLRTWSTEWEEVDRLGVLSIWWSKRDPRSITYSLPRLPQLDSLYDQFRESWDAWVERWMVGSREWWTPMRRLIHLWKYREIPYEELDREIHQVWKQATLLWEFSGALLSEYERYLERHPEWSRHAQMPVYFWGTRLMSESSPLLTWERSALPTSWPRTPSLEADEDEDEDDSA